MMITFYPEASLVILISGLDENGILFQVAAPQSSMVTVANLKISATVH